MSEDQPKQPAPQEPSPTPKSSQGASQTQPPSAPKLTQRSVVKTTLIKILRFFIFVLEALVRQLEAEPPAPSSTQITTPGTVETAISPSETPTLSPSPTPPQAIPAPPRTPSPTLWQRVLQPIRSRLPVSLNTQLSDPVLGGIVGVTLVVVVTVALNLLPGQPSTPTLPTPVAITPDIPERVPEIETPEPVLEPLPEIERPVTTLPDLRAPEQPQPIELTEPPAPKLTPEQYLIASIQNEITRILEKYGGGVVKSLQVNFLASSLQVTVGNDWYELTDNKQNQLANAMLQQAQELDFSKLEIKDTEDKLIARSPVVGSEMVIVQRRLLSTSLEEAS